MADSARRAGSGGRIGGNMPSEKSAAVAAAAAAAEARSRTHSGQAATTSSENKTSNSPHLIAELATTRTTTVKYETFPINNNNMLTSSHEDAHNSGSELELPTPSSTAITTTVVESNTTMSDFDLVGGIGDEPPIHNLPIAIENSMPPGSKNSYNTTAPLTMPSAPPPPLLPTTTTNITSIPTPIEKEKPKSSALPASQTAIPQNDLFKLVLSALNDANAGNLSSSPATTNPLFTLPPSRPPQNNSSDKTTNESNSSSAVFGSAVRNRFVPGTRGQQPTAPSASLFTNDKIMKKSQLEKQRMPPSNTRPSPINDRNGYGSDFDDLNDHLRKSLPETTSSTTFFDSMMNFNLGQFLAHVIHWRNPAFTALVLLSGIAVYSVLTSISAVSLLLYAAGLSSAALLLVDGWTRLIAMYTGQRHVDNLLKDLLLAHFSQLDARPLAQFIVVMGRELNKLCMRAIQSSATDWRLLLPCTMTCWTLASLLREVAFLNVALVALVSLLTLPKAYELNQAHVDRMTRLVQRAVKNTPEAMTRLSKSESKIEFLRDNFLKILVAGEAGDNNVGSYSDSSIHSARR